VAMFCASTTGAIWLAVNTISTKQKTLVELRERAGQLSKIAAMKNSVQFQNSEIIDPADKQLFLEAESSTIGRANLQSRIDAIAQNNNLVLASAGSLPDIDEGGITLIGLRVDVSGSYESLQKAIFDIETNSPPLLIRELSLRLTSGEAGDSPIELAAQIKILEAFRVVEENGQAVSSGDGASP
jgi:hypothetical protein